MKSIKPIKYFENLDALRGVTCLSVVFFHLPAFLNGNNSIISILQGFNWQGGKLGVFFFMTLSGFLITYLLLSKNYLQSRINYIFIELLKL
ncbi:acyltransferase family protein [Chryseobacterium echinoideorum]|uniref:acyltransferase family protein n=1 Tax=Chryseobacterium echinoideorum TaxID=1549648 RepID=UPI0011871162|nr:acyltransferase family protein [Chryseobacterium echinoideorum]